MNTVDYGAVIADLEARRDQIDSALQCLRALLVDGYVPCQEPASAKKKPTAPKSQRAVAAPIAESDASTYASMDAWSETLNRARDLYLDDMPLADIAKAVGSPLATVQKWSSKYQWKALKAGPKPQAPPATSEVKTERRHDAVAVSVLGGPCEWIYPDSPGVTCRSLSKVLHEGKGYCGNHNPARHAGRQVKMATDPLMRRCAECNQKTPAIGACIHCGTMPSKAEWTHDRPTDGWMN